MKRQNHERRKMKVNWLCDACKKSGKIDLPEECRVILCGI